MIAIIPNTKSIAVLVIVVMPAVNTVYDMSRPAGNVVMTSASKIKPPTTDSSAVNKIRSFNLSGVDDSWPLRSDSSIMLYL